MELNNFNVRELNLDDKININGGSKVGDFFANLWENIQFLVDTLRETIREWYEKRMAAKEAERMELIEMGLLYE